MTNNVLNAAALAVTLTLPVPAYAASFDEANAPRGTLDFEWSGSRKSPDLYNGDDNITGCPIAKQLRVNDVWHCTTYGSFFEKFVFYFNNRPVKEIITEEMDVVLPSDGDTSEDGPIDTPSYVPPEVPAQVPLPMGGLLLVGALAGISCFRLCRW